MCLFVCVCLFDCSKNNRRVFVTREQQRAIRTTRPIRLKHVLCRVTMMHPNPRSKFSSHLCLCSMCCNCYVVEETKSHTYILLCVMTRRSNDCNSRSNTTVKNHFVNATVVPAHRTADTVLTYINITPIETEVVSSTLPITR